MTGDVTTATVIAAHFQLCSQALAISGGRPAAPTDGQQQDCYKGKCKGSSAELEQSELMLLLHDAS